MLRTIILLALIGIIAAVVWQQMRYLHARRDIVHDTQPLVYSSGAFHVVTFLYFDAGATPTAVDDRALFAAMRDLRAASESAGDAHVVYAGKVAVNALASKQLVDRFGGEVPWSAVLLTQFDSRAAADRIMAGDEYRQALARFSRTYACGMQRSPWLNLGIPGGPARQTTSMQIVTGAPSHFPFVPRRAESRDRGARDATARRRASTANTRSSSPTCCAKGRPRTPPPIASTPQQMFGLMAEGVHGPMHIGVAVPLEAGDQFDRVALVYYPGVQYFADMMRSRFYRGIVGDKQLGDTQASITVPVLDRL